MKAVQIRMARAALGWGAAELAGRAGLQPGDVNRIEAGGDSDPATLCRLRTTFEAMGLVFLDADDAGKPGIRAADGLRASCEGIRPEDLNASNDG